MKELRKKFCIIAKLCISVSIKIDFKLIFFIFVASMITALGVATFAFSAAIKIAVVIACVIMRLFRVDFFGTKLASFVLILNHSLN